MEETRVVRHGQTQWTPTDRIAAYARWRENGSLNKTAESTKIPLSTLQKWCQADRWVARREQEDELERAMALQRGFVKIVEKVDPLVDALLQIALGGDKEQHVQLSAIKHALAVVGISPIERTVVTARPADKERGRPGGLSGADMDAIEAILKED